MNADGKRINEGKKLNVVYEIVPVCYKWKCLLLGTNATVIAGFSCYAKRGHVQMISFGMCMYAQGKISVCLMV